MSGPPKDDWEGEVATANKAAQEGGPMVQVNTCHWCREIIYWAGDPDSGVRAWETEDGDTGCDRHPANRPDAVGPHETLLDVRGIVALYHSMPPIRRLRALRQRLDERRVEATPGEWTVGVAMDYSRGRGWPTLRLAEMERADEEEGRANALLVEALVREWPEVSDLLALLVTGPQEVGR